MTENGRGVQVVDVTEDHDFVLDKEGLRGILMSDEVKDLPVAVVSLAGAFRSGKSFMLDFFLRYLTSPVSARANGSWLGEDTEPLTGFSWRGGTKRNTTGILLWSEPIVVKLPSGEKVAVILMDTQGTFDSKSTFRDCSTIFALSTLLSSVQVYNITGKMIQEDDLQHLQYFTEYGKLVNLDQGDHKAFQVLEFLVRDWENEGEYAFGSNGGQLYLDEILKIDNTMAKELSDLRNHIRTSFETVSCFLMPHPGFKVTNKTFQGYTKDIEPQFLESLKELTTSLFGPQKLKMKSINGRPIKARELFTYFVTYMDLFNSKDMPDAPSIMKATVQAGLLYAMETSRELYETGMEAACGRKAPSITPQELKSVHEREMAAAIATFNDTKKMGSKDDVKEYQQKLEEKLSTRLQQFMELNEDKTQKAVSDAKDAYEKAILAISGLKPLCLHPADLERLHNEAVNAAIKIFDSNRKMSSKDDKRADIIAGFKQRYRVLQRNNEGSNRAAVCDIDNEYWEYMQRKSVESPPLSVLEFADEHERALQRALDEFKSRRNRPDSYKDDVFKDNLLQKLSTRLQQFMELNEGKTQKAVSDAKDAYEKAILAISGLKPLCLHPADLERLHNEAVNAAIKIFDSNRKMSSKDDKRADIIAGFEQHYRVLQTNNEGSNRAAVCDIHNEYWEYMQRKSVESPLLSVAEFADEHRRALQRALDEFKSRRNRPDSYKDDVFKNNLLKNIEESYDNIKLVNQSKNKVARNAAILEYQKKMAENGRGVQVVAVTEDHDFVLDKEGLRGILMSDEVKDLPVAVISLAGAFRSGKSFMLDFFLRYLASPVSARADGSWLGEGTEPLAGFSWREGTKRETTGILMWSEPIVVKLSSGEKVAVILMDTQGTFDNKSTYRDCLEIFSFSTLLSSVQVYNITGKMIKEDDLQHLQFFAVFGKMANQDQGDQKASQVLEFLVRDWENEEEYPFGSNGGQLYLNEILKIDNTMAKELSDLRNDIRNSFETVSCFLMPHPGSKVTKKSFQGATKDIEPQFLESLKELTTSLFGPQKLKMKSINGRPIKARELFSYFVTYTDLFNSKDMPVAPSIMKATVQAGLLYAMETSRELYETGMEAACGRKAPSITPQELKSVHEREMAAAIATFNDTKIMGSKDDVKEYQQKLEEKLSTRLQQFMDLNVGKTQKAVSDAKDAYEKAILAISGLKPLCVHPADLERLHNEAVNAAIMIFDSNRKKSSKDDERADFIAGFEQRYRVLRANNEGSNRAAVSDIHKEYWQYMQRKSVESPPLSVPEFADEHERALQRALDQFKSRRNRTDSYKDDVFKENLLQRIDEAYKKYT